MHPRRVRSSSTLKMFQCLTDAYTGYAAETFPSRSTPSRIFAGCSLLSSGVSKPTSIHLNFKAGGTLAAAARRLGRMVLEHFSAGVPVCVRGLLRTMHPTK